MSGTPRLKRARRKKARGALPRAHSMKMDESFVEGMLRNLAKKYARILQRRGVGDFDDALQEARIAFLEIRETAEPKNWKYWTWFRLHAQLRERYGIDSRQKSFEMPTTENWTLSDDLVVQETEAPKWKFSDFETSLEKLTPKERDLIVSFHVNGESIASIAERYNVLSTTIRTYLTLARRKMRGGYVYSDEQRRKIALASLGRTWKQPRYKTPEERRERDAEIRAKRLEGDRLYRLAHKDEINARTKKFRMKHKARVQAVQLKYREKNREKAREYQRRYYREHRDEILRYMKEYRRKLKEDGYK